MGSDKCLMKFSWFAGVMPMFFWIQLDLFSPKGNALSSSLSCNFYSLGMALAAFLLIPLLVNVWHEASGTGACWLLGGSWFLC